MRVLLAVALLAAQAVRAPIPAALVEDIRRLSESITNEQRHEALTDILTERAIPFTTEPFTIPKPVGREPRTEGHNVVVTLGRSSNRGDIVVGAHYDAARLPGDGTLSRGAVDNAASAAMLVHVADALRRERPRQRVRIVWFDMEELGLLGSTSYLETHRGTRFAAMLNFDINAYGDTVLFGVPPGGENAELRRAVMRTCADQQIDCIRFRSLPPSDDRPFGKAGIPTVSLAMLPAVEAHQLWLMLQGGRGIGPPAAPPILQIIHTPEDVIGKVDGTSVARMGRFALALIRNVIADR